ncbi:hypothetical protein [Paracoccus denitrificans]|jgi:hypothetical protein|uniref:hypothetical protein n=1 Tax=Paracoccus denitrificans TaxID=266 RepID=UPI0000556941|nr:hypothetical protein [Paracoccus denitrificans]MBB4629329.1 hypothetical protein [Paracoccus denitrificans]MCU7430525.1 hypothetical protein [Paracoccus denitrificans]QAR28311.1 hypothetical protein EO213_18545 [Paracoccus denitrificans]UFS67657.1 hypothetical protein LO749_16295 [Paracoccus denitrificans]UPV98050.1 hypothetical protein M0K93_18620 [Paracoccus denitrificans]
MAPKDRLKELFRAPAPLTAMDRTTQEAKLIISEQAERRRELTANLRAARLAKEASETGKGASSPKKRKP